MSQTYIWFDLAGGWTDPETGETFRPGQTVRFDTSVTETAELVQRAIDAGAAVDLPQLLATFFQIAWSNITGKPSTFAPEAHSHAAGDIVSGEFADGRISESSVTQHQAALALAIAQVSGLQAALDAKLASTLKGAANGLAELDASSLLKAAQIPNVPASKVTGTLDAARIPDLDWSKIIDATRPDTLAGYGITDALTETEIGQQIQAAIDALVGGAPGALDTLNELAAALGDDPDAIATLTNAVSSKLDASVWQAATAAVDGYMSKEDKAKLDGIESGATADQTGAEIAAAYENEDDRNAYTDAEKSKLAGIEEEATKNAADEDLRDRSTHTGTQAISTVSGLQSALDGKAALDQLPFASVIEYTSTDTSTDLAAGAVIQWDTARVSDTAITLAGANDTDITFAANGKYRIAARLSYEDTSAEGVDVNNSIGLFFKLNGTGTGGQGVGSVVVNTAGANEGQAWFEQVIDITDYANQVVTVCTQRLSGADEIYLRSGESTLIVEKVGGKSALLAGQDIEDINGLQDALDSKASITHDIIDIAPSSSVITPATGVQAFEANSALETGWPAQYTVGLNVKFSENRLFQLTASNTAMWFRNGHNVNGSGGTGPGWYPWRLIWNSANFDPTTKADKSNTYTQAEVDAAITAAIDALIGGAPGALDTLNELAAALNDDEAFAASVTASLAAKAPLTRALPAGGTTGQVLAKATGDDYDSEWVDQSGGGGGIAVQALQTSVFTPEAGKAYPCDLSGGGFALTGLPSGTQGDRIELYDPNGSWSETDALTIPGEAVLNGDDVDLIVPVPNAWVVLEYVNSNYGWDVKIIDPEDADTYRAATVETPSITSPADDATDVGETIIVTASAFAMTYQSDIPASTDWQRSTASDFSTIDAESLEDASNLTTWTTPAHGSTSTEYFYRVRYRSAGGAVSEWSPVISVTTSNAFNITSATGGDEVFNDGDYTVHKFTTSGSFVLNTVDAASDFSALIVAGGGGRGGNSGGYGGAGEMIEWTGFSPVVGEYPIVVGSGGGAGASQFNLGTKGGTSSFNGNSANGGGGGGANNTGGSNISGADGGSGGGVVGGGPSYTAGGGASVTTGTFGTSYGNNGGGHTFPSSTGTLHGGGAGSAGSTNSPGGGVGRANSITGSSVTYAKGGSPVAVDENTGSGGSTGDGSGTDGVVIIRYRRTPV
ncbi:glycine-rich domain-containing protein [Marinicauda sp. Alg238-R41]|uniref:glycine-rich domain-containing protein n=1 Tax=Marinicauda sp. Alg238-R41 TaxID=2993447 RepID=UPI0022E4ABA4|nr:hypothetical protein [Marinicauda sp. Alg238-R41]